MVLGVKVAAGAEVLLSWLVEVLGEPARIDQAPVPIAGVLAARVVDTLVMQMVWSGPASAVVGDGVTVITTSSVVPAHGLFVTVQRSVYVPEAVGSKGAVGEVVLLSCAVEVFGEPARIVQAPVPGLGELAASAVVPVTQMV